MYVGSPYDHPEIDDNWEKATWGKYLTTSSNDSLSLKWDGEADGFSQGGMFSSQKMRHELLGEMRCINTGTINGADMLPGTFELCSILQALTSNADSICFTPFIAW